MPVKSRPAKKAPTKAAAPRRPAIKKPVAAPPGVAFQLPPADVLKKTIAYFYALTFIPTQSLLDFIAWTAPKRAELAAAASMQPVEYFRGVAPEVCRRMVAFHEATRNPDPKIVGALTEKALTLDQSPERLLDYRREVERIAALPGRASLENRLHRRHGCQLCRAPCHYGFFSLVSDPAIKTLDAMLQDEASSPPGQQTPLRPVYSFTLMHLGSVTGSTRGSILPEHLTNLAYCLLLLAMARSRRGSPERELLIFQLAGDAFERSFSVATSPGTEANQTR